MAHGLSGGLTPADQLTQRLEQLKNRLLGLADDGTPDTDHPGCVLTPEPIRIVGLYPGEAVAWDSVCGQLTFRLVSMTPKYQNDGGRVRLSPCAVLWWDTLIEVKVLRCVATVSSGGNPPSADKVNADGLQLLDDMQKMLSAIASMEWAYAMEAYVPSGPQGGGAAGSWTFMTRLDAGPC